mmetsp:Transcript_32067/g.54720  ORF Transcript_32067/g.54720 Transcript_32067/m.54720 type:complete len:256 (+) Transcript_32067:174-941(+)
MASSRHKREVQTARRNNSSRAKIPASSFTHPFAEGGFRYVAKGKYTVGDRVGEDCVCKWFKTGHVDEARYFDLDIRAMGRAHDLVREWNGRRMIDKIVKVNIPEVWTRRSRGDKVLLEPFIHNYQKFNSNSGWADNQTPWPRVMQALSHFSYHISGGQYLLCDLQGGVYDEAVVLTDPVIMSSNKVYGVTDLGPKGISSFFSHHVCNEYCSPKWSKPSDRNCYYPPTAGTRMIQRGGTHAFQHVPTSGPTFKRFA